MSNYRSTWSPYLESLDHYIRGLGESTGRFGGEDTLCCHTCGHWIETTLAQFSRYDEEPLCASCAGTEEAEKNRYE